MSPAEELAVWLAAQDSGDVGTIGATTGWAISIGMEPTSPDTALTLYDTGGEGFDDDAQDTVRVTFQVRARGFDYSAVQAKLKQVRDLLTAGRIGTFVGIWVDSEPAALGKDDNERWLFTANYSAMRED